MVEHCSQHLDGLVSIGPLPNHLHLVEDCSQHLDGLVANTRSTCCCTTTPCQLVQPVALDAVGTVEVTVPTAVFKTMSDKPSK